MEYHPDLHAGVELRKAAMQRQHTKNIVFGTFIAVVLVTGPMLFIEIVRHF